MENVPERRRKGPVADSRKTLGEGGDLGSTLGDRGDLGSVELSKKDLWDNPRRQIHTLAPRNYLAIPTKQFEVHTMEYRSRSRRCLANHSVVVEDAHWLRNGPHRTIDSLGPLRWSPTTPEGETHLRNEDQSG